jgi:PAS domain S-box-containing protein
MGAEDWSREQLLSELVRHRQRIAELEDAQAKLLCTEKALKASEERFRSFLGNSQAGVLVLDRDLRYVAVNEKLAALDGRSIQEHIGKTIREVIPGIADDVESALRQIFVTGQPLIDFETAWESPHEPGVACHWIGSYFPIADQNGKPVEVGGIILDVTAEKRAESNYNRVQEALKRSESLMRSILSASPVAISLTRDRKMDWVNEAWLEMFGYEDDSECLGQDAMMVYPDREEYERVGRLLYDDLASREHTEADARFKRRDGSIFCGLIRLRPLNPSDPEEGAIIAISDITERKQAEDSLRASQERLDLAVWGAELGLWDWDVESGQAVVNERYAKMLGYSHDKMRPSFNGWKALLHPEDSPSVLEGLYNHLAGLTDYYEDEYRLRTKSGQWKWILSRGKVVERDKVGRPLRMTGTCLDISKRKCAEEALAENETRYRTLFESMKDGVAIYSPKNKGEDFVIVDFNKAAETISGLSRDQVIGQSLSDVFPGAKDVGLLDVLGRTWRSGEPTHHPVNRYRDDRIEIWVENFVYKLPSGDLVAVFTDETERKQAEEALKESEEWYRTLVEQSFDGLFVQKEAKVIFANPRLCEMLGYSQEELEGTDHWKLYHPDYQNLVRERAVARLQGENVIPKYGVKFLRKDGSFFEGEINSKVINIKGQPGIQVWARDVSERKRSQEAQRRLATAVEQAAEAVVITDVSGTIEYVNPAFERISGYKREEVIGQNPKLLSSGEHDRLFYERLWNTINKGDVWVGRFINKRKDGSLYHEDSTISPVRDSTGKIINFVAVKRDMTEHLELSKQLLQAQKMEAIGTLAGGIAHDFNNLLQVTLGYSELLISEKEEGDPQYADLSRIIQAAKNGAELVQRLLTFSRKVDPKRMPLDLNRRIVQVEKLLRRTIPKMIDIQMYLSADLAEISADPIQMEQVLMNMAVNARDAMPNGGKLIIETRNVMIDEDRSRAHVGVIPGNYVLLTVSDTGHGMDQTIVEHIFEPFYTTKELGRGTGLGLAMVYGIIRQHEGFITCHSKAGTGTAFNVYLPAIETFFPSAVETSQTMPAFGSETVLLVDDETDVRELGARILTNAGYTVLTAANGIEALDLYRKNKKQIALVILDLIMPEMGGDLCLEELLKIEPGVKVLVASGYAPDSATGRPLDLQARGFVSKPFRLKELLCQVRKTLD